MAVFFFIYGTEHYCVRIGFTGSRPLVYAVYRYNTGDMLPLVAGQTYRSITAEQYDWIMDHRMCDVSYVEGIWAGRSGNLECRTHGSHFKLFSSDPVIPDFWDERQV